MQLDKTEIAIRERSTLELFDLTLIILRRHFRPLIVSSAIFGLPLMVLCVAATFWMVGEEAVLRNDDLEAPYFAARCRHAYHLVMIWFALFPLASFPATIFIGNQIFFDTLGWRDLWKQIRPVLWRSILVLGIFRLGFVPLLGQLFVNRTLSFEPGYELFVLGFVVCGLVALRRATHPFAPEILGLEACKLRAKSSKELTYKRRLSGLHGPFFSENIGRFLSMAFFVTGLVIAILSIEAQLLYLLAWLTVWPGWIDHLFLPLALWLGGIMATVFRFLSYLDARIRLEGWEVELQLKAERQRLLSRDEGLTADASLGAPAV